jgi:acyl-CoA thioesterase-1
MKILRARGSSVRPAPFALALVLLLSACSFRNVACSLPSAPPEQATEASAESARPSASSGDEAVGIAFLGDSLTAGSGLLSEQAFPARIEAMFHDEGYPEVVAINAGVSGDTTAGGLRRVETLFEPHVRILVVALGGNDALRGLTVAQTRDNLDGIIQRALAAGVEVLLAGMQAPTNLGPDYQVAFRGVFETLAVRYGDQVEFVPFLLEGVAANPALNQADGIHPTPAGAQVIADLLYPRLRVLADLHASGGGGA